METLIKANTKFSNTEVNTLKMWKENNIIGFDQQNTSNSSNSSKEYKFMDGPPFVTSNNFHYGHVLVGSIKDVFIRYKTMNGFNVTNKLGYDCHGLPIEMMANKILNLSTKSDVLEYGIGKYNRKCKELVDSYSGDWLPIYDRMARKHDPNNEYRTLDLSYMESVWNVFGRLWEKDLVYQASKIMPYSTKCSTTLSNFEVSQGYKDVIDKSVFVKFPLHNLDNNNLFTDKLNNNKIYALVWTTTPWTLPMNMGLCVHPELEYVKIHDMENDEMYIVARSCLDSIYKKSKKNKNKKLYEIIESFKGSKLENVSYDYLYHYYYNDNINKNRGRIVVDGYVSSDSGTGIVHMAPAFGEDDLRICIDNNIIKSEDIMDYCPIDDDGYFTDKIKLYSGKYFKDIDSDVIKYLKNIKLLFKSLPYKHSYPHCWRTDTPLINRPVSSFFINVKNIKEDLIENNKKVNWIPSRVGTNKFGKWISNARDWCVSRSRFFGTPIPVWQSDDGKESICISSVEELVELGELDGKPINRHDITDIHRENIDSILIKSKEGRGYLKRVESVFDCWFESGSVPYAQDHYSNAKFEEREYLSDFVCEGLDQTRGWFYTTMVLSTALDNKPAFKNVICTGLVLAEDGKKMSKSKQNYSPIDTVFEEYGSDALRLYLISSNAAKAESTKFIASDIKYMMKKPIQLVNCLNLWIEQLTLFRNNGNVFDRIEFGRIEFDSDSEVHTNISDNKIDIWILSCLNTTIRNVDKMMNSYQISSVKDILFNFIENVCNWYIKFRRNQLQGKDGSENQRVVLSVLYYILHKFIVLIAPFMPFLSEHLYQVLNKQFKNKNKNKNNKYISVHNEKYPTYNSDTSGDKIEKSMKDLQDMVEVCRLLRQKSTITSSKMPLRKVSVYSNDKSYIKGLKQLDKYLKSEINYFNIEYSPLSCMPSTSTIVETEIRESTTEASNKKSIYYSVIPNRRIIARKYKNNVRMLFSKLDHYECDSFDDVLRFNIDGENIELNMGVDYELSLEVKYKCKEHEYMTYDNDKIVMINTEKSENVENYYVYRMFVKNVQNMRQLAGLHPWNPIDIYYSADDELSSVLDKYKHKIESDLMYKIYRKYISSEYNIDNILIQKEVCLYENINVNIIIVQHNK